MKRSYFWKASLLVILVAGLLSCKKSYTCECVTHDESGTFKDVTNTMIIHDTKANAKAACEKHNTQNGSIKITCHLQ